MSQEKMSRRDALKFGALGTVGMAMMSAQTQWSRTYRERC